VPTKFNSPSQPSRLRPESQRWVDASIPRKPFFDWRELVIQGMHLSGALYLARRISKKLEMRPKSSFVFPSLRRVQSPKFVVLCYHGIGECGNSLLDSPTAEMFEAQMCFLRQNYRVVSLEEVCRELNSGRTAEPGVAVTFDDGYRSTYTAAFPVLQKYSVPATIYLTFDTVDSGQVAWYDRVFSAMAAAPSGELELDLPGAMRFRLDSREDRLRAALQIVALLRALPNSQRRHCCDVLKEKLRLSNDEVSGRILTWGQIHSMQDAGISFGSHTLSHPVVSQLEPEELERELMDSKRLLEQKLCRPVLDFAFPFGKVTDCNYEAAQVLAKSGYRSATTTVPGVNTPDVNRFEFRRLQVGDDTSLARFAFDLEMAFLRPEEPRTLFGSAVDSGTARLDAQGTNAGTAAGGVRA
jgi:peptidoglycan/xylan/chitin deacetylase (PgdA/CDA1 family)